VLKWAGAAYLVFIGIRMLFSRPGGNLDDVRIGDGSISLRRVFWQGALTNILNPKVALFFLAFLPQFVDAESPHKAAAFVLLGLIFICNGSLWCFGVAVVTARTANRVRRSGQALLWINRALGGMFVYLGARIALLQAR
jgi:threonine/homoserine/homoserine lactone efflux protein